MTQQDKFKQIIEQIRSLWPDYAECYQIHSISYGMTNDKPYANIRPKSNGIECISIEGISQAAVILAALQKTKDWHYYELRDWKSLKEKI